MSSIAPCEFSLWLRPLLEEKRLADCPKFKNLVETILTEEKKWNEQKEKHEEEMKFWLERVAGLRMESSQSSSKETEPEPFQGSFEGSPAKEADSKEPSDLKF